jgi:hypothetical protein
MTASVQLCLGHFARVATNLRGFPLDVGVFQIIRHGIRRAIVCGSVDAGIVALPHPGQLPQLLLGRSSNDRITHTFCVWTGRPCA